LALDRSSLELEAREVETELLIVYICSLLLFSFGPVQWQLSWPAYFSLGEIDAGSLLTMVTNHPTAWLPVFCVQGVAHDLLKLRTGKRKCAAGVVFMQQDLEGILRVQEKAFGQENGDFEVGLPGLTPGWNLGDIG
jgi:hypothetical protein